MTARRDEHFNFKGKKMQVIQEPGSRPIKIWTKDVEESAMQQLKNTAKLPFIHKNGVVAMPDVHFGLGATIGSVIATTNAVIPAAVGVDLGCGMCAIRLSLKAEDLPDNLKDMRVSIEREVLQEHVSDNRFNENSNWYRKNRSFFRSFYDKHEQLGDCKRMEQKIVSQMGTLGGGNHFVEVCLDEENYVWVMLHSGSRGIGNMIGRYFISEAKENLQKYFVELPDNDLAYIPEHVELFRDYIDAVHWAQDYALKNREAMMSDVLSVIKKQLKIDFHGTTLAINCHHNYVEKEHHYNKNVWITRKGAIRAREGDYGIIPGSMGQKSYIVKGKGNCESYHSCSHGAGRAMGRNVAKSRFTEADLIEQTKGVECKKDKSVLDEIPAAYKDIDQVMANQTDLVQVIHTLKQVLCVKN